MNEYKHPKFTKDLAHGLIAPTEDQPYSEFVFETLLSAGINPSQPIYTVDGDRVRLLAIDCGHTFPLVGEVIDFGAETTWLGRWSASGVYASSKPGAQKHALKPNDKPGRLYLDPARSDITISMADYIAQSDDQRSSADFAHGIGATVYKNEVPRIVKNLTENVELSPTFRVYTKEPDLGPMLRGQEPGRWGEGFKVTDTPLKPQPQVDRAGSGGRVRSDTEQEYDAAFAEAVKRENEKVTREPFASLKVNAGNGAPAKLDPVHVRAGFPPIDVSKQLITNAQDIIRRWTAAHEADATLHTETAKHINLPEITKFYAERCNAGKITHEAHLWILAATYCMAGRVRIKGAVENLHPQALYYLTSRCGLNPTFTFVYYQTERVETLVPRNLEAA